MRQLKAADLFCGAGGTSQGAKQTGAVSVRFALNHWQTAVETHSRNFPEAKHVNSRLENTHPGEAERFDILFASPECTHHSRARGGRPTLDQQRSGAWHVLPWIEHHRPSFFAFENVVEFEQWGPVASNGRPLESKKGAFFDSWLMALRSAGYRLEVIRLNAADFGAATSRERLFVIGRKGNRSPNLPDPTHSRWPGVALPGMQLLPWRAAFEVIDWTLPCPSIFSRKRPLADKTLLRIEAGLRKFVGPFVVPFLGEAAGQKPRCHSLSKPLPTITTSNPKGLAVPFTVQWDNQSGGGSYCRPVNGPLGTFVTKANQGVAIPYIVSTNHGEDGHTSGRTSSLQNPLGSLTCKNGKGIAIPFLSSYYGNDAGSAIGEPVPTIVTKDRHSLILAHVGLHNDSSVATTDAERKLRDTMRELGVCDIGFRMFQNHELSLAQGFPAEYIFCGGKADVTKQIGNSVSPVAAEAITRALMA